MKDFQNRLESLNREAADCELIAKLATDKEKAARFQALAEQYRAMANDVSAIIATISSRSSTDS